MRINITTVAVASLAILFSAGCNSERENMPEDPLKNLYLSPSSESQARAERLLPSKGAEDASFVLGDWKPDLPAEDDDREEYLPEPAVEWVIDVEFPTGTTVNARELSSHLDKSFCDKFGPCSLYGKDASSGFWTFLVSADGPENVTGLKVAYDYERSWDSDFAPASEAEYEARLEAVKVIATKHIGDCKLTTSKSSGEAARYAHTLSGMSEKYDQTVAIYLVADRNKPFPGKEIWDVMMCLGLQWGDMDCFHWNNPDGAGDDYFFSVETSTPPGYFLPEQVAAGELETRDLIFLFSVPRTCQPAEVAKRMDKAVQYCQKRLGGSIHYTLGEDELTIHELVERVSQIEADLKELGFEPGSGTALQLF